MALYEDLYGVDVIARIPMDKWRPKGGYYIDIKDGLIHTVSQVSQRYWARIKHPYGMRDEIQFNTLFALFSLDLLAPPIRCHSCWKVVVVPETLHQLMLLYDLMVRMNETHPTLYGYKCGIEVRDYVDRQYGGYFYNRSVEEGEWCLEVVKEEVKKAVGNIKVYLKRGCTEMEKMFGDTDKWKIRQNQHEMEEWILKHFWFPEEEVTQPQYVIDHIRRTWIKFAAQKGDITCKQYSDEDLYSQFGHEKGE